MVQAAPPHERCRPALWLKNLAKELFGFDRARAISGQHAAAIVAQVQSFGQEDDITVLGVQFAA